MRYVEINARNYWWTEIDDFRQNFYKERANNEFVKKWIDTTLKRYIINEAEARLVSQNYIDNYIDKKEIPEYVKIGVKNQNLYKNALLRFNVEHAIDYLNTLPPRPIKMSVEQVREAVKKWDEQKVKVNGLGKIKALMKVGSLTWYELQDSDALKYESQYMNHCVGKDGTSYADSVESGETQIYSLRDSKNIPHITIEVTGNELIQCKGNSNKPFKEIYKEPVIKFLNSKFFDNVKKSDSSKDLINNDIYIHDSIAYSFENLPEDYEWDAKSFSMAYNNGHKFNKVTIKGNDTVYLKVIHDKLKISCYSLSIRNSNKGSLELDCTDVHINDFEGNISGKTTILVLDNSKVHLDCFVKNLNLFNSKISGKINNELEGVQANKSEILCNIVINNTQGDSDCNYWKQSCIKSVEIKRLQALNIKESKIDKLKINKLSELEILGCKNFKMPDNIRLYYLYTFNSNITYGKKTIIENFHSYKCTYALPKDISIIKSLKSSNENKAYNDFKFLKNYDKLNKFVD